MNDLEKKETEDNVEKAELVFFYIVKEIAKFVLFVFIFIIISGKLINDLAVYYSGGLIEYLKHDTLRLFTDNHYMSVSLTYARSIEEYFTYITDELHVELHLWIIPYCMSILCSYPAYWLAHKIVDRSGIGATKRLDFLHFIFIFTISNIVSRLFTYDVLPTPIIEGTLWWYIFYKVIKIAVLKIKEKSKKQGE